jgi:hypothetical protein
VPIIPRESKCMLHWIKVYLGHLKHFLFHIKKRIIHLCLYEVQDSNGREGKKTRPGAGYVSTPFFRVMR